MATRFHIGAKTLRGDIASYSKRFDLLEVASGAPGATAPTMATLRKWRKSVPPHFAFSVLAAPGLANLKPGEALDRDVAFAIAAVDALEARVLLLQTPAEVTPSTLWRDRLARAIERFPRDVTHVVWEPRGLWEVDDAAVLAKKLGIVLAVDAARDPVPLGPVAYVRLRALGETRSFGTSALERIERAIGPRRDAFVVFETDGALAECKVLRKLVQTPSTSDKGGLGRVVRPRGATVTVRDDEQE
jgi:uncharacterized protein YecE (DUF72 family)